MFAEKRIVCLWLQHQGFFVATDINAGHRVVDILAFRPGKIWHVEVSCSVAKLPDCQMAERFESPHVVKAIRSYIKSALGSDQGYENVLVSTGEYELKGIVCRDFAEVMAEAMKGLDTQNYQDPVIRTLQLCRFSLLNSACLNDLMDSTLSYAEKDLFLQGLLDKKDTLRLLKRRKAEHQLIEVLKKSSMRRPERLAKVLHEQVLSQRQKKKFLKSFLEHKGAARLLPRRVREKPLHHFIKEG